MTGRGRTTGRRVRGSVLVVLCAVASIAAGCGTDTDTTAADEQAPQGSITVSTAASLAEPFTTIQQDFTTANPGAEVVLNVGSSGALSRQILEGAPVDVAAFADTAPMGALAEAGLLEGEPEVIARNRLTIVTRPGNPRGIETLADLADAGVVSLCVDSAPCGRFADRVLADAGVTIPASSVTRGADARSTLAAVTRGDAVAGIVYVTDAASAGDEVDVVDLPDELNLVADYPIAVTTTASDAALARAFVAHVRSDAGRGVLTDAGFLVP